MPSKPLPRKQRSQLEMAKHALFEAKARFEYALSGVKRGKGYGINIAREIVGEDDPARKAMYYIHLALQEMVTRDAWLEQKTRRVVERLKPTDD